MRQGKIDPVRLSPPYEWEVRVLEGQEAALEGYLARPGAERVDERTAVVRTDRPAPGPALGCSVAVAGPP